MENLWEKAEEILKSGGVVIIPSDSCYGLAALAANPQAVEKLYKLKGRERGKPSLIIVGSLRQAEELVGFTPLGKSLAKKYWPGGLTLILKAKNLKLAPLIYGEGMSLAIRFPDKKELQRLALAVGSYILPSANLAGGSPPNQAEDIDKSLLKMVDFFLDEPTDGNIPSTLVDARGDKAVILRQGSVKIT